MSAAISKALSSGPRTRSLSRVPTGRTSTSQSFTDGGGVINHYFVGHRNLGNVWKYEPTDEELLKWAKEAAKGALTDVWDEKKPTKSKEHPTMKPVALVGRALHASSQNGDIVLDAFGGSGSTLIACEQMGRKCRIMELDPKYCDVIVDRWEKLTGRKAVLTTN